MTMQQWLLSVACDVAQGRESAGASGGWYRRSGRNEELNDGKALYRAVYLYIESGAWSYKAIWDHSKGYIRLYRALEAM